jgi:predicted nucleic acid-binding Zn finger protein
MILSVRSEKKVFQEIYYEVKKTKKLTDKQKKMMIKTFGTRFKNAYKTVLNRKVRKYVLNPTKQVWVVIGKGHVYQILPSVNFCSCNDFYFRVIGQEIFLCYHLLAQKLADALEKYVVVEKNEKEFEALIMNLREMPRRKNMRSFEEMENIRQSTCELLTREKHQSITQILEKLKRNNFSTLTTRNLTAILRSDKKKRFQCSRGLWSLVEDQER